MNFRHWLILIVLLFLPASIYAQSARADSSSVEWIKAYFNMPADYSLTNSGADMHHKFAVIDAKSSTPQDDIVWTESTNLTVIGVPM